MSRKKVILSIFLMITLVLVGIVLPTIWKMEKHDSEKETESNQTSIPEKGTTVPKETVVQPEYIHFDALKEFFSENQMKLDKMVFHLWSFFQMRPAIQRKMQRSCNFPCQMVTNFP